VRIRPDLAALDEHIAQVRREKETGIDTQGSEAAAALYDKEKDLFASKTAARRSGQTMPPGCGREFGRVSAELERLRAILRDHGIEPGNGTA
jgi:hypothetical protein